MAKPKSRETKIKALNDYIWTLEDKCDAINKMNIDMIMQYCRFVVLTEELSVAIAKNIEKYDEKQLSDQISKYEKLQKLALNIYKALKLDEIKSESDAQENPFLTLLTESKNDGDF